MSKRSTHGNYADPLDLVWLGVAHACGFKIHRSNDAYASFDGKNQLTICTDEEFDPDDSLAQMILHELCHALVGGKKALKMRDWGLTGQDGDDLLREYATHRLQAMLCDQFGLREMFAVTTEWRAHFDELGDDPLQGDHPSASIARQGLENAKAWNWEKHILKGLEATATIAEALRPFSPPSSLWAKSKPLHPTGFVLDGNKTCNECAWSLSIPEGGLQCQHTNVDTQAFITLEPETVSCHRFEEKFTDSECGRCGACCREGFDAVAVGPDETIREERPDLLERQGDFVFLPRPEGRCSGLQTNQGERWRCDVYALRPQSCRDLEIGSVGCLQARQRMGLSKG